MFRLFRNSKKHEIGKKPMILAHRGARKVAPENTLAAFKKAIKLGFDGIEMDVVLTKDKVPIVFHGNDLSHSTRENGFIHEMTSSDIFKVDAGSTFEEKFKGEKIPTLAETLDLFKDTNMLINIELKNQPGKKNGIETAVAEMIYNYGFQDKVLISSFSPLMLRRFSKISPKIPSALLIGPHPFFFLKTLLSANMLKVTAINPVFQYTSERLVNFAHTMNWRVFTWTINTRQEYKRAVEMGVDGIITDEPELLKLKN